MYQLFPIMYPLFPHLLDGQQMSENHQQMPWQATFHQLFRVDLSVPRFVELAEEVLPKGRAARCMARDEKLRPNFQLGSLGRYIKDVKN